MSIIIYEDDTKNIGFKELGFYVWLKANTKTTRDGNLLSYLEIEKKTGTIYRTARGYVDTLVEKGYIRLTKKGIPARIYVKFLK